MIKKADIRAFRETSRILLREDEYVYLLPHPALQGQISNYTVTFPNPVIIPDRYTVIPHGSATAVFLCDGRSVSGTLFGPLTKPCAVGSLANSCEMLLIIEFQPAGLAAFTGVRQKELTDRTAPLESIHPRLNAAILETLERAENLEELIGRLDGHLLEHLHAVYPAAFQLAADTVRKCTGGISCKALSDEVHYSERHLERLFETYLGMTPKVFSRVVRVNRAIRLLQDRRRSVTRAAWETGFYDLPHFIHAFRSVCGMTPGEYRDNMSDFYSEIAKF